jgi:uncharacterized protein YraI
MAAALVGVMAILPSSQASAEEGSDSPIVTTALQYLGTHGGQCWTFMKQVVAEATGAQVGFDYRQGYFEAGAVEVSPDDAVAGDIIQVALDSNTSASASYSGLHTAIIMKNLGGGRFDAIDSNQNWDEMVALRPNYNPYTSAARNGMQVHIYRIPGGGPGAISAGTTAAGFSVGEFAVVSADPGCLNLRDGGSTSASRIACLPTGTSVKVLSDPVSANGLSWLQVESGAGTGWVAALYLAKTQQPTAVVPPPAAAAPAAAVAPDVPTATVLHVDNSPGCLRLRSGATVASTILTCMNAGTAVTLNADASVSADGYDWVHVTSGSLDGWVARQFLVA